MKSDGFISNLARRRLLLFVTGLACCCFLFILGAIKACKGDQSGKVYEVPGSEIAFRLVKCKSDCRILDIYSCGQKENSGENRIRIMNKIPWRSMIYVSTCSPDSVFVDSHIEIISTSSVRIEKITPQVESRDSNYVRCWFAPMANKMFEATGEETYSEIKPEEHNPVNVLIYIFAALSLICGGLFKLLEDKDDSEDTPEAMPEDLAANGKRMVRVDGMRRDFLDKVLKDFMEAYRLKGIVDNIDGADDRHILKISSSVDLYTFSLLINYLTYCDRSKRYAVTGWYEVGQYRADNKSQAFSHKTLMFYIPESDEEYDNAYFVTPEGAHFKQSFNAPTRLRAVNSETREYETPLI